MSDLDYAVVRWRRTLARLGVRSGDDLDELEDHLRSRVEASLANGQDLHQAFNSAMRCFGSPEDLVSDWVPAPSSQLPSKWKILARRLISLTRRISMTNLAQDLRFALRMMMQRPGFTGVIVLVLALGMGTNTAVFSVLYGLLWRPLNLTEPERLVKLAAVNADGILFDGLSYPDAETYGTEQSVVEGLTLYFPMTMSLRMEGSNELVWSTLSTVNYFDVLGVRPFLGRFFGPEVTDRSREDFGVVVSYRFWQNHLAGDPEAIGRPLTLNGRQLTVIGVAPQGFKGSEALMYSDLWVSLSVAESLRPDLREFVQDRKRRNLWAMARLQPGVTLEQAQTRFGDMARHLAEEYPDDNGGIGIQVFPESAARLGVHSGAAMKVASIVMLASVSLVLLIACVNVANLLLAKGLGRRGEIGVRLAMGASRMQLVRQLLTESLLLAVLGGLTGFLFSEWTMRLLSAVPIEGGFPIVVDFSLDGRVLLYAFLVTALTGIFFGLGPALQATGTDLVTSLRTEGRSLSGSRRGAWVRKSLVVVQVASSLVLLITAGLFARSLQSAAAADVGFEVRDRLTMSVNLGLYGYDEGQGRTYLESLRERVTATPGVHSAAWAWPVPLDTLGMDTFVAIEGYEPPRPEDGPMVRVLYASVEPSYFSTMGTPVMHGRTLTEDDRRGRSRVAVINQTMAEHYWQNGEALGKRFRLGDAEGPWVEVVGIAADGKYRLVTENPLPFVYIPFDQTEPLPLRATLVVHAGLDPKTLSEQVREASRALDPNVALVSVRELEDYVDSGLTPIKLAAFLISAFGLLGLILAVAGLYGLQSYTVSRDTQEIGVRMALGASRGSVLGMVLRKGAMLAGAGVAFGLLAATALSRLVGQLLYNVSAVDPLTFIGVSVALFAVAMASCWLPARRATRIDPVRALRHE